MPTILRFTLLVSLAVVLTSCAIAPAPKTSAPARTQKIRTTAYTHNEGSGGRNALGRRLSGSGVRSASSDWSRFPVGTRFRVLSTGQEYVIDDYGGALVGTNTIDLYHTSRGAMYRWGVRNVEIEILQWGSKEESLKILRPRKRVGRVRQMIAALEKKPSE